MSTDNILVCIKVADFSEFVLFHFWFIPFYNNRSPSHSFAVVAITAWLSIDVLLIPPPQHDTKSPLIAYYFIPHSLTLDSSVSFTTTVWHSIALLLLFTRVSPHSHSRYHDYRRTTTTHDEPPRTEHIMRTAYRQTRPSPANTLASKYVSLKQR
jgi:hypothetical protein